MALTQLGSPYPVFTDLDGTPLDGGFVYIGVADDNPETAPILVYYDQELTQVAPQPLRTVNGYVMRNGAPAILYADATFSVTVRNRNGALVLYAGQSFGFLPGGGLRSQNNLSDVDSAATSLQNLGLTATAAELNFSDGVTSNIQTQLDGKAPLASPALTGTPTAPTATTGTDTTQVATTAFVQKERSLVFIESQDVVSVPSVDFTGLDETTYDGYLFRLVNIVPAGTLFSALALRTSADGGATYDNGSSDYAYSYNVLSMEDPPVSANDGSDASTFVQLTDPINTSSGDGGASLELRIHAAGISKPTMLSWDGAYRGRSVSVLPYQKLSGAGLRDSSVVPNAVRFFISDGSNLQSGTITMYGLKNS